MEKFFSFTPHEYFLLGCAIGWIFGAVLLAVVGRFTDGVQVIWLSNAKLLKLSSAVKHELLYRFPERANLRAPRYDE